MQSFIICIFAAMACSSGKYGSVTVIVPAYNGERWLRDCLDSVARQSFEDWHLIVVSDGSTDATDDIAREYAASDSRFALMEIDHGGVSAARNVALDVAQGEWVMFLDADDVLSPMALARTVSEAIDSDAEIVIPTQFYGEVPESLPDIKPAKRELISSHETLRRLLLRRGVEASMSGTLYRRSLFEYPRPLRFRNGRYEDLDLGYLVIERAQRVVLLKDVLYYYRKHESSFMQTFSPARFDVLDAVDRMWQHFRGTSLEKAAADRRFGAHYNILLIMYTYAQVDTAMERRCLNVISHARFATLVGAGVRLKNRLGAIVSFGGRPLMRLIAKIIPQR